LRFERAFLFGYSPRATVKPLFSPNVRYGDITLGLPVLDNSAAGVFCSHVLEHLPRDAVPDALLETKRVLRPGGRFRLVVPDLEWRALHYVDAAKKLDPMAADRFLDSCLLGMKGRERGFIAFIRRRYGLSDHRWMYDYAVLKILLEEAGFTKVRRCEFGDSGDPMFSLVEAKKRFFEGTERELAMEAIKPD
jgi:SAM-dependent methyltransferase